MVAIATCASTDCGLISSARRATGFAAPVAVAFRRDEGIGMTAVHDASPSLTPSLHSCRVLGNWEFDA
jgi:hypothetical protein